MKKLISTIILSLALSLAVSAQVTINNSLAWNPSADAAAYPGLFYDVAITSTNITVAPIGTNGTVAVGNGIIGGASTTNNTISLNNVIPSLTTPAGTYTAWLWANAPYYGGGLTNSPATSIQVNYVPPALAAPQNLHTQ